MKVFSHRRRGCRWLACCVAVALLMAATAKLSVFQCHFRKIRRRLWLPVCRSDQPMKKLG